MVRNRNRVRLLLLLKPFEVFPVAPSSPAVIPQTSQILNYLDNRREVHKHAIQFCQDVLRKRPIDWIAVLRNSLAQPIRNVDLVVTVGGDGTLLQAAHFLDDSIPVLGVNSDPTQTHEVEEFGNDFDATRSTGFLCGATVNDFEQVLDSILEGRSSPSELSRLMLRINAQKTLKYALNDILIAHPCPAAVSRFSMRLKRDGMPYSQLVNCRSSGLRVSTAAGSTAAMLSAGGFKMPIFSKDLQYMVREPITPGNKSSLMHGVVKSDQHMEVAWFCKEGVIYIDGSHQCHSISHGDSIEISSQAPVLKVHLPSRLLS
ncbi:hypothetical protein MLD38_002297 [Melastoma candidum]|uniref:Uncharacterized protein n=1 Tax=Melastoma candidum TaxID=119954 RepID=A0ACB9SGZ2_9MYRT|nr:hypothetical protein MLD38_002297 [Melastoma candidum]